MADTGGMAPLELWGGAECTVNRVGDDFADQTLLSGHQDRIEDLDLFADLGIRALRQPVLWERISPERPDRCEWEWTDRRLDRLRELGVRPIVGLIHHGSGPRYSDLLDPGFAAGLARHAAHVAERYDWVEDWTPVNEPLTTARFSALYGHWYPHRRDEPSFWLALLNQIDGVRLSMRAVRATNPAARLIQTDDLGRTYATASLRDQAAFDNVRRWMGWDLLCGKVVPGHPFWQHLSRMGFGDRLRAIADDPCPPDVIGVNHYLTSNRFLDHRLARYPARAAGGNDYKAFADVEAVRVLDPPVPGLEGLLREAWERYRLPIAVTEVHNGCTREEQMRWMADAWRAALDLRAEGVPVQAVTSWALLGSYGWNTLLTSPDKSYEAGVFDVGTGTPRATGMVALLKTLAAGVAPPALVESPGWWRRPDRLLHPAIPRPAPLREHLVTATRTAAPPLLLVGANGRIGQAIARACAQRNIACVPTGRAELDTGDDASIARALDRHRPWTVIDASGWTEIAAGRPPDHHDPVRLAAACAARNVPTVTFSTAPDGTGASHAERGLLELGGAQLIVRTGALFGADDPDDFAVQLLRALAEGRPIDVADDRIAAPTYLPDLADAALDLLIDGETGIRSLTQSEAIARADFARRLARAAGLDEGLIRAARPADAALPAGPAGALPPLAEALARCAAEIRRRYGHDTPPARTIGGIEAGRHSSDPLVLSPSASSGGTCRSAGYNLRRDDIPQTRSC